MENLNVKGKSVNGEFVIDKIFVPKGAVNEKGEKVKTGFRKFTQQGRTPVCGGKPKPDPKDGNGDWFCVEDEWVWFPG